MMQARVMFYILVMISMWAYMMVLSHDHYILGKVNRYRFRFWFAISGLNIIHLLLVSYIMITNDYILQDVRWMIFLCMELLMFESMLSYTTAGRRVELFFRLAFYITVIGANAFIDNITLTVLYTMMLVVVAFTMRENRQSKWFGGAMVMYMIAMVAPKFCGPSTPISLFAGTAFTVAMLISMTRAYRFDLMHESITLLKNKWKC